MKPFLLVICLGLVSACASTPMPPPAFRALPDTARGELRSMEVLVGVDQQEIEVGNSNYIRLPFERSGQYGSATLQAMQAERVGGGSNAQLVALGVIVAAAVVSVTAGFVVGTGEAGLEGYRYFMGNRAIAPVSRSLSSFDFGERLRLALIAPDGPQILLREGRVSFVTPATPQNFEAHHAMSDNDCVMLINIRYAASADLNTLTLKAEANLIPKSDALWKLQYDAFRKGQRMDKLPGALQTDARHALYRRVMSYQMSLPQHVEDRDKAAQAWAADDGAMVRNAFNEGLGVIARLIALDLAGNRAEPLDVAGKRYRVMRDKQDVTQLSKLN